jgi:hypothetical protein
MVCQSLIPDVSRLSPPLTIQMAPDEVLVALGVEFKNKSA